MPFRYRVYLADGTEVGDHVYLDPEIEQGDRIAVAGARWYRVVTVLDTPEGLPVRALLKVEPEE